MKVLGSLLTLILCLNVHAQSRDEILEEFLKERKKMMESIMKMFEEDSHFGDSFFDDDFDPFKGMKSFKGTGQKIDIEEKYEEDGSISILITPKQENMSLDIQTKDGFIIIKSETKVEEKNEQGGSTFKNYSMSSFSRSIAIPDGYSAKGPVAEGKSLKISLVPSSEVKKIMQKPDPSKTNDGKMPIMKRAGEETI